MSAAVKMMNLRHKRHNGYILVLLLVVIAIGLMIYYMDIMWMGGDGQMIKRRPPDQNLPWKYENLIRNPNQPHIASKPIANSTKPAITRPLELEGEVQTNGQQRGQVSFAIEPDGTISGKWDCRYSYTHASYVITAEFNGNTDTAQNAPDDFSKLFLIAKGDYLQKATNLESGEVTETKGTVYVSGWLGVDFSASGKLSITTDKKWHADYNWTARP
jgi:hypothetical protein